jgi:predicted phage terminase large subunit-like protein
LKQATLNDSQKLKVAQLYQDSSDSIEYFCDWFMKDDGDFQVPTRDYRMFGEAPEFQREIFESLDVLPDYRRFVLASPRGFMKSMTCSMLFPLHAALFKKFNNILIVSNSESLAINFLRKIKINMESNRRIVTYLGDHRSEKWTENHIITREGVNIRACGWGAQIRGFRPDLIILDDIESDETVKSPEITKKIEEWILKAAINALTVNGSVVFLGTLINRLSVIYRWINNPPEGWYRIFNQAYRDGIQEEGRELWPEVWGHARLQQRKAEIGSWAFASEFMNDPVPSEGNRFNPSTFKYFTDDTLKGKKLGMYFAIDPAFSEESTADYGVIIQILHDDQDNIYVDRYYRAKTTAGNLIQVFKGLYKANRPHIRAVGVENIGPQKAFYEQLVRDCGRDGLYPLFKELKGMIHTSRGKATNKEDRITYAIQPRLEAGKIFFRHDHRELIEELTLYPEVKHDDTVDALAYAIHLLEPHMDYSLELIQDDFDNELATASRGVTGYGEEF